MNFLAHIYLSGSNDEIRLGNFIGDYVKGSDYNKYSPLVKAGIILHRKIDYYTDTHEIVRYHKSLFYGKYHKYSGIVIDILYDHFLSTQWNKFSNQNFDEYIANIYQWIEESTHLLPDEMQKIIPSLVKHQWLKAYTTLEGLESVLIGMSKGTSLPAEHHYALFIIRKHYHEFKNDFLNYFTDLETYVQMLLVEIEEKGELN